MAKSRLQLGAEEDGQPAEKKEKPSLKVRIKDGFVYAVEGAEGPVVKGEPGDELLVKPSQFRPDTMELLEGKVPLNKHTRNPPEKYADNREESRLLRYAAVNRAEPQPRGGVEDLMGSGNADRSQQGGRAKGK